MNGQTLQALRGFLFFTTPEAARMIGSVQERSWRRWEAGGAPVPVDIQSIMRKLIDSYDFILSNTSSEIIRAGDNEVILTYYDNIDDWLEEPIMWRVHCAVMAKLAADFKNVSLVAFNSVAYRLWLGTKDDTKANRAAWVAVSL